MKEVETTVDFTAPYAKNIVRGTITLPSETPVFEEYRGYYFYLELIYSDGRYYTENISILNNQYENESPKEFAIYVPIDETQVEYRFSYYSYDDIFNYYGTVYVNRDGSTVNDIDDADSYTFAEDKRFNLTPKLFIPTVTDPVSYISDLTLALYDSNDNYVLRLEDAGRFSLYLQKANKNEILDLEVIIAQYSPAGKLLFLTRTKCDDSKGNTVIVIENDLPELAESGAYNVVMVWSKNILEPVITKIK